jgi:hypothetical protein
MEARILGDFRHMYARGQKLATDAELQNGVWLRVWVGIYRQNEFVDYGGFIEKFDRHAVCINGGYFLRSNWQFIVREAIVE